MYCPTYPGCTEYRFMVYKRKKSYVINLLLSPNYLKYFCLLGFPTESFENIRREGVEFKRDAASNQEQYFVKEKGRQYNTIRNTRELLTLFPKQQDLLTNYILIIWRWKIKIER